VSICTSRVLTFEFLFSNRNKFAVSLEASTLQNQDSMVLSLHKKLVLCFTSLGRSIITRIRERNFEGLLKIKNIACGVFLKPGFHQRRKRKNKVFMPNGTKEELRLLFDACAF